MVKLQIGKVVLHQIWRSSPISPPPSLFLICPTNDFHLIIVVLFNLSLRRVLPFAGLLKEHLASFGFYQMANSGPSSADTLKICSHVDLDSKEKDMDGHWQNFQNRVLAVTNPSKFQMSEFPYKYQQASQPRVHQILFYIQLYTAL